MGFIITLVIAALLIGWLSSLNSSSSSSNSVRTSHHNHIHSNQNNSTSKISGEKSTNHLTKQTQNTHTSVPATSNTNKSTSNPHREFQFTPTSGVNFSVSSNDGEYNWYALYHYYPKNRFHASELSQEDRNARNLVYNFKDGRNVVYNASLFASALTNRFGKEYFIDKILLVIPASNKARTEVRFKDFCRLLSLYTGMTNGYEMLTNNNLNRSSAHLGGNRNATLEQYINFSGSFYGKKFIVVDDVRTSGSSSKQIYYMLIKRQISSVSFFYMAKTVSHFY